MAKKNGVDCKLNQTDINAINTIVNELDIANKKLKQIEEKLDKQEDFTKIADFIEFHSNIADILIERSE